MSDIPEMTPSDGSLESAADALTGLLSSIEKKEKGEGKPEPVKTQAESEPKQAQPESQKAIEDAKSTDDDEPDEPVVAEPRKLKVKIDGIEQELPEDEVVNGYSRTADYTRKTQQLAEQRKQFEQNEVAAVRAERQQYAEHLAQLKQTLESIAPKKPDFERLKLTLPADQYAARLEEWHAQREKIEAVEKTQADLKARQDADAERGFQQYLRDEQERLAEKLPEMKDPEKGKVLKKDLSDFALSRGFTEDDLSHVTDHRLVLLLHDAMQGAKQKAKAPEIKNKIEKVMEPTKPGSSKQSTKPGDNQYKEASQRLRQSGKLDDAADALTALLQKVG
jgi:hypothetical protein